MWINPKTGITSNFFSGQEAEVPVPDWDLEEYERHRRGECADLGDGECLWWQVCSTKADKQVLNLGDIVDFGWKDGYSSGTVIQVHADGLVDIVRPFIQTADYSSIVGFQPGTLAVSWTAGFETVKRLDPSAVQLLRKSEPKK